MCRCCVLVSSFYDRFYLLHLLYLGEGGQYLVVFFDDVVQWRSAPAQGSGGDILFDGIIKVLVVCGAVWGYIVKGFFRMWHF